MKPKKSKKGNKMNKQEKTTLITGLWKNKNKNGEFLIGRIGANLYAIVIPNATKKENQPDSYLYFVNGSKDEVQNFIDKKSNL